MPYNNVFNAQRPFSHADFDWETLWVEVVYCSTAFHGLTCYIISLLLGLQGYPTMSSKRSKKVFIVCVLSNRCLFANPALLWEILAPPFPNSPSSPNLHRAWQSGGTLHAARGIESIGMIDSTTTTNQRSCFGNAPRRCKKNYISPFKAWKKCATISWWTQSC